ncbi:unnamed protein product [Pleuronectes platessa]|uniref:Uncharacterized protein n=1 Tax=Pleuronectes platessa TaxID=8262 RepID=A0A9N7VZ16_PLEPL|nr:unnamed protein product [Pleuronectes platessa]
MRSATGRRQQGARWDSATAPFHLQTIDSSAGSEFSTGMTGPPLFFFSHVKCSKLITPSLHGGEEKDSTKWSYSCIIFWGVGVGMEKFGRRPGAAPHPFVW